MLKPYGTGHKYARLLGYTSAGKTGTAQIYDNHLRQYTHLYNASFMGFAPVTNPRIVIVVTINGTEGTAGYGGPTSAPVFREVAAAGLRVMDVPKDLPEMVPFEGGDEADENDVAIADLGSSIPPPLVQADNAVATDDRPVASANNALDQRVLLARNGNLQQDLAGPRVPDFQGKTVRSVIQQAAALGIPVEFTGSGVARAQAPVAWRNSALGELGSREVWPVARPHDSGAGSPGRPAPEADRGRPRAIAGGGVGVRFAASPARIFVLRVSGGARRWPPVCATGY